MDKSKKLVAEIIEITGSEDYKNYYNKAIKILGYGTVINLKDDLKMLIREGKIKNPAGYFYAMVGNEIEKRATDKEPGENNKEENNLIPYEKTHRDLLNHLIPKEKNRKSGEIINENKMRPPYSGESIPHPTFIGPEFFTLSTNKKKSEKVNVKFITQAGTFTVPVVKGKTDKDSKKEKGLLTVHHKKILDALKVAWAKKRCDYFTDNDGYHYCKVVVSARELADILKWSGFGKNTIILLKDSIDEIRSNPNYVDLEKSDIRLPGIKSYHFYFISEFTTLTQDKDGQATTYFAITFSSTISWQLLNRYSVKRSLDMFAVKSELTHLIWSYVEPTLRKYGQAQINLSTLIQVLHLPKRKWHKLKSRRKRYFTNAIKELNGQKLADGRIITAAIEEGLQDYMLVAHLSGNTEQITN